MTKTNTTTHHRRGWRPTSEQLISTLVVLVAVISTGLYVQQSQKLSQQSRQLAYTIACQTQLNEQFRDALQARSDAAGQQNQTTITHLEAEKAFLVTLGQTPDQPGRRQATEDFLRVLDERISAVRAVERARVNNPLPELESCH